LFSVVLRDLHCCCLLVDIIELHSVLNVRYMTSVLCDLLFTTAI